MHVVQGLRACVVAAFVLSACAVQPTGAGTEPAQRLPEAGSTRGVDPAPDDVTVAPAASAPARPAPSPTRPDIVLVLMDDFSMDLLQTMRSAETMRRRGASYSHAYAVDSLCCVSRSSLLTGQYPHQTGVLTNVTGELPASPLGGFSAFTAFGNPERSFNVALDDAGYTTGFVGKYLNEYEYRPGGEVPPLLPGWTEFEVVFGSAYDQWDFWSSRVDGAGGLAVEHHPAPPPGATAEEKDAAYAGTVIEQAALRFVREHRDDEAPYFLEVAPYGPHHRTDPTGHYPGDPVFPAMFRDRPATGSPLGNCGPVSCAELTTADLPGYGDDRADNVPVARDGSPARAWNTGSPRQDAAAHVRLLRDRARMVQSVDRTVEKILDAVDDDTYVVLTSDNGFHLGQQGLGVGKGTAYDTDVHVPLLVVGPGVVPGERTQLTANVDLAATFEELAGLVPRPYRSGRSLVDTFADPGLHTRDYVFLEHTGQASTRLDPDAALTGGELDRIPSYVAVRTAEALLVRHDLDPRPAVVEEAYEFYSYRDAAWERTNSFTAPRHEAVVGELLGKLAEWDACTAHGDEHVTAACRRLTDADGESTR